MPNKGFSLGRGSYLLSASPNSLHCSDLMLELTFLICCLIMQCAMHGCEYPRELYNGRLRTSCCHRCKYTNGQEHNSTCVAYTSSSHRRSRSSSQFSSREAVVPEVRERHRHCFVITLGLRGHFGMQLLEHNRAWLSSDHCSELALLIVFSATATEHGCSLIPTVIRQS